MLTDGLGLLGGTVIFILFGHRLPSVMRSLGQGVVEFKKGVAGIEDDLDQAVTADRKRD